MGFRGPEMHLFQTMTLASSHEKWSLEELRLGYLQGFFFFFFFFFSFLFLFFSFLFFSFLFFSFLFFSFSSNFLNLFIQDRTPTQKLQTFFQTKVSKCLKPKKQNHSTSVLTPPLPPFYSVQRNNHHLQKSRTPSLACKGKKNQQNHSFGVPEGETESVTI